MRFLCTFFGETNREDQGTYLDLLLNILINFLHADLLLPVKRIEIPSATCMWQNLENKKWKISTQYDEYPRKTEGFYFCLFSTVNLRNTDQTLNAYSICPIRMYFIRE